MNSAIILQRAGLVVGLMLPLAACENNPQQPSGTIDDRSSQSPYVGDTAEGADTSDTIEPVETSDQAVSPAEEGDPVLTGAIAQPERSPITGAWAADATDCTSGGGTLVTVTADRFEQIGKSCEIASIVRVGDDTTMTLSCSAAGAATSEIVKLAEQDDGSLMMNEVGTEELPLRLEQCP